MKRNLSLWVSVVLLGGLVLFGLLQLFDLRFRSGDIFPAYSSFRADPQGAKIWFQSLEEYPGLEVRRQLKPMNDQPAEGRTLLMLGCSYRSVLDEFDDVLDSFMNAGGHVLMAFAPENPSFRRYDKKEKEHDADNDDESEHRTLQDRWKVNFDRFLRSELENVDPEEHAVPVAEKNRLAPVPWSSALFFKDVGEDWTVLYEFLGKPVVMERAWGKGSVVLMADSYLFSNESMVVNRHTEVLVRLIGQPSQVFFDELHLGVESQEGIMMLVRRYRLTGVLLAILLLTVLYVWRRSVSFIPKYVDLGDRSDEVGMAVDARQGFTNLLARHIPAKELLSTMAEEWRSTFSNQVAWKKKVEKFNAEFQRLEKMEKPPHPVEAYNRITEILNERK